MITKLNEESILVKNWKIYLDMVGKNGVSKMVLIQDYSCVRMFHLK